MRDVYFLFSGEGKTDFGGCTYPDRLCEGDAYQHGPMAVIVDKLVEMHERYRYSILQSCSYGCISEHLLAQKSKELLSLKKSPQFVFPGRKAEKETAFYFRNARALAFCALECENTKNDEVIGILFRDSDGTVSAGCEWKEKVKSMERGFRAGKFERGVPMVPKPKSEAWIICAVKNDPYVNCECLEDRSGNDDSPNSLKNELAALCGGKLPSRKTLCQWVDENKIDVGQLDMHSFREFKKRLNEVLDGKEQHLQD